MIEQQTGIWFLGAVLGVLFVLFSVVSLVFLDGNAARDLVGIGLGGLLTVVAYARSRGWRGTGR